MAIAPEQHLSDGASPSSACPMAREGVLPSTTGPSPALLPPPWPWPDGSSPSPPWPTSGEEARRAYQRPSSVLPFTSQVGCSELLSSLPSIVGSTHLQMKVIDG
ncbi:uncharacterized protein LOC125551602 isoform X2 [Triticum urartu]|uniref:uncharacterized protein LOC125551602 isoform X2 n=1 Tax=Triticum urartu TaxID=4572 RepID=UPI002043B41A|nr:uncharacterized protein LOC125551602 isoform X2 [Triticum urartu]